MLASGGCMSFINDTDIYYFKKGTARRAYSFMGCHKKDDVYHFNLWAPNASSVSVIGDFNQWNTKSHVMKPIKNFGIWHISIDNLKQGMKYKYHIVDRHGNNFDKSDPYAFFSESPPGMSSIIYDFPNYTWNDGEWYEKQQKTDLFHFPFSIYEVHSTSFIRTPDGDIPHWEELADHLIPWVLDLGFTHIELMPITEYPFEGSWGYQTTGYFAPTHRHGDPVGLMKFIDRCHQVGLGVILDWVPSHFPKDAHALWRFDGTPLYEHPDPRLGEQPQWQTAVFDFGRCEVQSFLISSAIFWLDKYHFDGLRLDAVSSMIYRTFGRENSDWLPDKDGGEINKDAVLFLQRLSETVSEEFPDALLIAEESTAWPGVTRSSQENGLGFSYKWNMGWMNDILRFIQTPFDTRPDKYEKLTFTMYYSFSENYILPFSHDEVVHGKLTLLDKMPGEYKQKFSGLRTLLAFMYAHPGAKLLFMGTETAPFMEWRYYEQIERHLLKYPIHDSVRIFIRDLNNIYKNNSPLWDEDHSWDGFEWIVVNDRQNSVISFMRIARSGEKLVAVFNFLPRNHKKYRLHFHESLRLEEILNSDNLIYGGSGLLNPEYIISKNEENNSKKYYADINLPSLSAIYFKVSENGKDSIIATERSDDNGVKAE